MLSSTRNVKSQLTMEFIIFIALGFLMMFGFIYIIEYRQSILREKREILLIKDLAYSIQSEFDMAAVVENGYSRNFTLPQTLEGLSYTASITNNTLTVSSQKFSILLFIPEVKGSLNSTINRIRKEQGVICLNTDSCP